MHKWFKWKIEKHFFVFMYTHCKHKTNDFMMSQSDNHVTKKKDATDKSLVCFNIKCIHYKTMNFLLRMSSP